MSIMSILCEPANAAAHAQLGLPLPPMEPMTITTNHASSFPILASVVMLDIRWIPPNKPPPCFEIQINKGGGIICKISNPKNFPRLRRGFEVFHMFYIWKTPKIFGLRRIFQISPPLFWNPRKQGGGGLFGRGGAIHLIAQLSPTDQFWKSSVLSAWFWVAKARFRLQKTPN